VDATKKAATKAVEAIVNYGVAKFSGKKNEAEMVADVAKMAMAELGHTSRTAIEAMERVANQRAAIRLLVSPVGESCSTLRLGAPENGAIAVNREMREAIDAPEPIEIGREAVFEIKISELDLKNRTCKFELRDDDDPERRVTGEITDPVIHTPRNPYSDAMNGQRWLHVRGKPQLRDGEVERLYISDADEGGPV
jgi:hypothetical protein